MLHALCVLHGKLRVTQQLPACAAWLYFFFFFFPFRLHVAYVGGQEIRSPFIARANAREDLTWFVLVIICR